MTGSGAPEVWLRGPVDGVPPGLQPVAHALLQAREEIERGLADFPDALLCERPAGVAPVGFHLRHIPGVIDRLFTYARGEQLSEAQREALAAETTPAPGTSAAELVAGVSGAVAGAVERLGEVDERTLTEGREVGRARLPSTVQGLLFHVAEHTMRHVGQMLVTARLVRERGVQRGASVT